MPLLTLFIFSRNPSPHPSWKLAPKSDGQVRSIIRVRGSCSLSLPLLLTTQAITLSHTMHRRNKRPFSPSSFHKTRSKHPRSSIRSTLFALGRASVDAGRNSSSQTTRPLINNSNVPKINSGDSRNGFQRFVRLFSFDLGFSRAPTFVTC